MSTGADAKTMPVTAEYESGYERTFGRRRGERGRWIYDAQGNAVPADQYRAPDRAIDAPIMVDRFMEGAVSQDGVDIGSRRKRAEYMRATGSVDSSDASPGWIAKRREDKEARTRELTKKTVVELSKVDTRHLPRAIEELKGSKR